jgi:hypothetical protein
MSESFDVHVCNIMIPGTLGDGDPTPLFHVPASAGAITILECQYTVATADLIAGTCILGYGTQVATNGSVAVLGTLGTSFGTGGGTFPALSPISLTLTASPCVVPANNWVTFAVGTLPDAGQSWVTMAYVLGRQIY